MKRGAARISPSFREMPSGVRLCGSEGGQAPLGKGQAVERRSRDAAARAGSPAQGASPSEGGKIRAPCMIWGLRTAKTPLGGKMFARCIPQRRSAGLFGCMARISCQNKLYLNTCRRYVATKGRFSRPRPLRERIGAQSCHGRQPGNAPGHNPAMAGSLGTHRGDILPRPAARERTGAICCHGQAPDDCHRSSSTAYLRPQWGTGQHTPLWL